MDFFQIPFREFEKMVDLAEEEQQLEEANTKHQQNLDNQVAGTTINTDNTLVLELAKGKNRTLGSSPLSPIIQVDGRKRQVLLYQHVCCGGHNVHC